MFVLSFAQEVGLRIVQARENINLNQAELAKKVNINVSVLNRIEQGTRAARDNELLAIAKATNVSVDFLLGNNTVKYDEQSNKSTENYLEEKKSNYYTLTDKEKKDIALQAEKLIDGIENSNEEVNFYGEPATKDQRDRLVIAIRTALEMNKEEAKRKFTRKDLRDPK